MTTHARLLQDPSRVDGMVLDLLIRMHFEEAVQVCSTTGNESTGSRHAREDHAFREAWRSFRLSGWRCFWLSRLVPNVASGALFSYRAARFSVVKNICFAHNLDNAHPCKGQ
jgi:hypothetical protein